MVQGARGKGIRISDRFNRIDRIFYHSRRSVSRSKFITLLLRQKIQDEQAREIREAYDRVYSDASVAKEQVDEAA